jgi:uncharacterized protein (DUF302 family)
MTQPDRFGDPKYSMTRHLTGVEFDSAVQKTRDALAAEGFGVLTEIDVRATLKKKLDVDFRAYTILGACNPALAHQALEAESQIGLLLPCNVVVQQDAAGEVTVSVIDPKAMFQVVEGVDMGDVVEVASNKLRRALDAA